MEIESWCTRPLLVAAVPSHFPAATTLNTTRFKDCFACTGDNIDLWNRGLTKGHSDHNYQSNQAWLWELT